MIKLVLCIIVITFMQKASSLTPQQCCAMGVRQAVKGSAIVEQTETCYKDLRSTNYSLNILCSTMQKICCLKAEIKQACARGEAYSKPIHASTCKKSQESSGVHASTHLSCCECCTMGKQAAKENITTCNELPIYNKTCDGIYYRCCKSAKEALKGPQTCDEAKCDHECKMTLNGPKCECRKGFEIHSDNTTCADVNECDIGVDSCRVGYQCLNIPGSYLCRRNHTRLKCPSGYVQYDTYCKDIDECISKKNVCPNSTICENTLGSYQCVQSTIQKCESGYFRSMDQCVDKNECKTSNPCRENERCVNLVGSYKCVQYNRGLKCPLGYKFDGRSCRDVNECETDQHTCRKNGERCINILGSYRCTCKTGYKRDDFNGACVDIDECSVPGRRLCDQVCLNTVGSFRCKCHTGFQLKANNRTCGDINECYDNLLPACPSSAICINARGSYKCIDKECPTNYRKRTTTTCKRDCAYGEDCDHLPVSLRWIVLSRTRARRFRMTYFIDVRKLSNTRSVTFTIKEGNDDNLFKLQKIGFSRVLISTLKSTFLDRKPFQRTLKLVGDARYGGERKAIFVYYMHIFFY